MNVLKRRQKGAILFVVLMVMLMTSILVMMAVRNSKTSTKIGLAQAQQVEAFDNAETLLARIRFALEQIPLPPAIAMNGSPDFQTDTVIWLTGEMAKVVNNSGNVKEPVFAAHEFPWMEKGSDNKDKPSKYALTCGDMQRWLIRNKSTVSLECGKFPSEQDKQPLIFIEFVTKQQSVGDIDDMRGAYFYRITILGQGFYSGRNIVQGVTGVEYI